MSLIEKRIASLEQLTRDRLGSSRMPGISDGEMMELRRVAATCGNLTEFSAYLRSRLPSEDETVISLEDRRRADAVIAAAARTIYEEVRLPDGG